MPAVADQLFQEMRGYLKDAGSDQRTVERAIEAAAARLGLDYSRAFSFWYGRAKRVWADELEIARVRYQAIRQRKIAQLKGELARLEGEDAALTTALADLAAPAVGPRPDALGAPAAAPARQLATDLTVPHRTEIERLRRAGGR